MINIYCDNLTSIRNLKRQETCSHVISTPHFVLGHSTKSISIDFLNKYSNKSGMKTIILDGLLLKCDFFFLDVQDVFSNILNRNYTLAKSRYLLVYAQTLPDFWEELVLEIGRLGIVVILAHIGKRHIKEVETLGVLHMVDSNNITGKNGSEMQKAALRMVKDGIVSFVGGQSIKSAYDIVYSAFGSDISETLFYRNPSKVILDKSIY